MGRPFVMSCRVRFRDTDAAGIMHFSAFFTYMEDAEHALLRSHGLSVVEEREGWTMSWPRVSARCDFRGALRFEEVFDVEVSVVRIGERSVTYRGRFMVGDELRAEGEVVAVCCRVEPGARPRSMPIEPQVRRALEEHLLEASE